MKNKKWGLNYNGLKFKEVNFEESIIKYSKSLDRNLQFIQLGCNDGKQSDPIYSLIKKDIKKMWTGIFLDANDYHLKQCKKIYKKYVDEYKSGHWLWIEGVMTTIEEKPSETEKYLNFYYLDPSLFPKGHWIHGIGSLDYNFAKVHAENKSLNVDKSILTKKVKAFNVNEIFKIFKYNEVDLLQTDLEFFDVKIINEINKFDLKPKFIHFEAPQAEVHHRYKDPKKYEGSPVYTGVNSSFNNNLNKAGYELFFDVENRDWLAIHESAR